jgi:hypothetical protein
MENTVFYTQEMLRYTALRMCTGCLTLIKVEVEQALSLK